MGLKFKFAALLLCLSSAVQAQSLSRLVKDGDIILQRSQSSQARAIQEATHSQFTHVGIIFFRSGSPYVYEAHSGVNYRSLSSWVSSGLNGKYMVRRLRNASSLLTSSGLAKLKAEGLKFYKKSYDIYFDWSDGEIYCSELVWKMFDRALGVQVGQLQHLRDFDLSSPAVKKILAQRYGNNIPYGEIVVAPAAIAESTELVTVTSNWFN